MQHDPPDFPEKLSTIKQAAQRLNVYEWKLRRAIKLGLVPSYAFVNRRQLVRVSEVLAAIEASRTGGDNAD